MLALNSFLSLISISLVLVLELAIAPGHAAPTAAPSRMDQSPTLPLQKRQLQPRKQTDPPPPPTNPGSSAAGGRRDSAACPQDAATPPSPPLLTALSPTHTTGLTLAEHPTFLVYVPQTSAESAEFGLSDRAGHGVYRTTVALTHTQNLIRITIPDDVMPLELDQQYIWSFAIICNPSDRVEDLFVTGTIQRTELDSTRLHQIEQAPVLDRIALYQAEGIWYDALALLVELHRSQPDDPSIRTAWTTLLQSGGVDTMIDIPSEP